MQSQAYMSAKSYGSATCSWCSRAYSSVNMRAMELYPRVSPPRSRLPASQFRGLSAAGSEEGAEREEEKDAVEGVERGSGGGTGTHRGGEGGGGGGGCGWIHITRKPRWKT